MWGTGEVQHVFNPDMPWNEEIRAGASTRIVTATATTVTTTAAGRTRIGTSGRESGKTNAAGANLKHRC